ncbi:hypothetical protein [Candidatus Thiodictyon syntrophicum]|uniref:hypothetical protein n=1 Tax=Candidatus Thiodictyon syntrophicum TaxID=1166950 RepID=UPI0012FDC3FD|nr:hypothetical protein [Candidatus Thiodictyon syntrophicum]
MLRFALSGTTPVHAILREIAVCLANIDLSHVTPAHRWATTNGALLCLGGVLAYPLAVFDIALGFGCGLGLLNREDQDTAGEEDQQGNGYQPLHNCFPETQWTLEQTREARARRLGMLRTKAVRAAQSGLAEAADAMVLRIGN